MTPRVEDCNESDDLADIEDDLDRRCPICGMSSNPYEWEWYEPDPTCSNPTAEHAALVDEAMQTGKAGPA